MSTDIEPMKALFETRPCLKKGEIKAYVHDNLTSTKRMSIENHLLDCPLCDRAVEGYRLQQRTRSPNTNLQRVLLPAILVLLTLALLAFFLWPKNAAPDTLFQAYYQTPQPKVERAADPSQKANGLIAFQQKQYQEASTQLQAYISKNNEDQEALFFGGIAALEQDQLSIAYQYLQQASEIGGQYSDLATWYLALTHVKSGEVEKAKATLQNLTDTPIDALRTNSQTLLQEISGMKN